MEISQNKKIFRVVFFAVTTMLMFYVAVSSDAIFKPQLATVTETKSYQGVGPNARTYTITKNVNKYVTSSYDGPVKISIIMLWVVAFCLLLGMLFKGPVAQVLVFIVSAPFLIYVLFVSALIQNF